MSLKARPKRTVLVFLTDHSRLLMIEKKRGLGAGFYNVPGGKCEAQENPQDTARREFLEETGLELDELENRGQILFRFENSQKDLAESRPVQWDNLCEIFTSSQYRGVLLGETEESKNFWIEVENLPFERMWEADRRWVPRVPAGESVYREYVFDHKNALLSETIREKRFL